MIESPVATTVSFCEYIQKNPGTFLNSLLKLSVRKHDQRNQPIYEVALYLRSHLLSQHFLIWFIPRGRRKVTHE
jgi:hypothetical protein